MQPKKDQKKKKKKKKIALYASSWEINLTFRNVRQLNFN